MKFHVLLIAVFALSQSLLPAVDERLATLQAGEQFFTNVTVTGKSATDLYITHSKGITNVKMKELSPDLQKRFGYDPAKGAQAEKEQNEAKARGIAPIFLGQKPPAQAAAQAAEPGPQAESPDGKTTARELPIKFTAVDGREVDMTQMRGKVVLVDFWATWCGPCVRELPNVKAAYEKLHDKGLEIVGISFDVNKQQLTRFVEQQKMPWPQYFDGRGWENKFGRQYDIHSIPTMWLVDKNGRLRDTDGRDGLAGKVQRLLAE